MSVNGLEQKLPASILLKSTVGSRYIDFAYIE